MSDLDSALKERRKWIHARGGLRPGWTPRAAIAAFAGRLAQQPLPARLIANLAPREPLMRRRLRTSPLSQSEFEVSIRSCRQLGRHAGAPAAIAVRREGSGGMNDERSVGAFGLDLSAQMPWKDS